MDKPKNLGSLNNHLFAQLERLSGENLYNEKLRDEIDRAKAITGLAQQVIQTGHLALKAQTELERSLSGDFKVPAMLEG